MFRGLAARLIRIFAIALVAVGTAACPFDSDDADDITGSYILQTVDGRPLPVVESSGTEEMVSMTLTLDSAGGCTISGQAREVGSQQATTWSITACTYTVSGSTLTLTLVDTVDGRTTADQVTATISGTRITLTNEEGTYVFEKA